MPNPKAIDVPKLGFSDAQTEVLNIMMNKEERDYSTVDEMLIPIRLWRTSRNLSLRS